VAIALMPDHVEARDNLAWTLSLQGDLQEALAIYRTLSKENPDFTIVHFKLGAVLQELGRHEEAVEAFANAIAGEPRAPAFHVGQANSLRELGRREEAAAAFGRALRHDPRCVEAYRGFADVLMELRRWTETVDLCETWLAVERTAEATQSLGQVLLVVRRFQDAERVLRQALELSLGSTARAIEGDLAVAIAEQGRLDEAVANLEDLIASESEDWYPKMLLSGVLLNAGRGAEALRTAKAAVRNNPDAAQTHAAVGAACLKIGQTDESLAAFTRATELAPECWEFYAGLGAALSTLERHSDAVAAFETLLEKDPEYFSRDATDDWKPLYEQSVENLLKQRLSRHPDA
jgi:protein O-GlcNAc transferase